jgi:hypothetical protein
LSCLRIVWGVLHIQVHPHRCSQVRNTQELQHGLCLEYLVGKTAKQIQINKINKCWEMKKRPTGRI